jgi:hypothetical protein
MDTRETPYGAFGRPVLAGITRRKHRNTRRVEVESKRFSPLAFLALAAHAPAATDPSDALFSPRGDDSQRRGRLLLSPVFSRKSASSSPFSV